MGNFLLPRKILAGCCRIIKGIHPPGLAPMNIRISLRELTTGMYFLKLFVGNISAHSSEPSFVLALCIWSKNFKRTLRTGLNTGICRNRTV